MRTLALSAGEAVGALFPVVDPVGAAPAFAVLTSGWSREKRLQEARRAAIVMAAVLIVFMAAGEPLLRFFGVSLESLQVAGGLVIGVFGFQMIFGIATVESTPGGAAKSSIAFTPMALPLLAGPGAMGVVMGLDSRDAGALRFPGFAIGIVVIAAVVYLCLRGCDRIVAVLGEGGTRALTSLLGLIVLAIGVELVIHGIVEHGAVVELTKGMRP